MQLRDYLQLKGQTLTDFAAEYLRRTGTDPADAKALNAALARVSRHASGERSPRDEDRAIYDEITKGAVTAQDWTNLAVSHKDDEAAAA